VNFFASRKELPPLEDFLSSAKSEVDVLAFSIETVAVVNKDIIVRLLIEGKHLRFILLNPSSVLIPKLQASMTQPPVDIKARVEATLKELKGIKDNLPDIQKGRLDIRTHDIMTFHSILAIDAHTDDGVINVESFIYGKDNRSYPSLRIGKREQPQLFEKFWQSYEYVRERSTIWP
jgi:hypothetical protein